MTFPSKSNRESALSFDEARTEVVRDIYEETKELHNFQEKVKTAFAEWLEANFGEDEFAQMFNLVKNFDASFGSSAKAVEDLKKLSEQFNLDEEQKSQFEDFLGAFAALSKAFEILRDFEISSEEIQRELADLKAEILKPLEIKGEKFEEVLSEEAKLTLERLVTTKEYTRFKSKFLSLDGVRKFLREEERDLDFDKNDKYNVDVDFLVKEVVGYMIDLGIISKPEDLQKVFDDMIVVGGVFKYKEEKAFGLNTKVGKNALFIKAGDKIITIKSENYGAVDVVDEGFFSKGVEKNLQEAADKLGVSPQKLIDLLNFDAPYGKIGHQKIGMEIKQGETVEVKETEAVKVNISEDAKIFLKGLFDNEKIYHPERGEYGLFRVSKDGKVIITAPFVRVVENGVELSNTERMKLYKRGLTNKNIELIVDPVSKNIKEVRINESKDGKTHIEVFAYTPEKISYGGDKLFKNFENLPSEAVAFLNDHMEVDEKRSVVKIDGQEIPLGTKVVLFKKDDGEITYRLEKGEISGIVEFEYQTSIQTQQKGGFELYQARSETAALQLPQELKEGIEITPNGVVINLESLSKVLGTSLDAAEVGENLKIENGGLVVPGHRGTVKILDNVAGVKITYERGNYPLQLVYVSLEESGRKETISNVGKKYELTSPEKIESLEKVKDIGEFVERNKLTLAKLNMFDEYYEFINSYKSQNWSQAVEKLEQMLTSFKAKEFGIDSPEEVLNKVKQLKGVDLIYALSLFVKGTLTDEYLLGENLGGEIINSSTRENIAIESLEVKKKGFIDHIGENWGKDVAERLKDAVGQLNPQKIDVSPANREIDKAIVASLVYTKRAKEESFSLLPHGLGDVLEGKVIELNDLVLARKILEKMPQSLLQNVLENYGIDKYIDVSSLSKEEILELFMGEELDKGNVKIRIYGRPLYYLYGECINPTVAYRVEKVVITKKQKIVEKGKMEAGIVTKGYRLLQEARSETIFEVERERGGVWFKPDEISKVPSQVKKVGDVEVVIQETTGAKFNTIDVIPQQGIDWTDAIGSVDYEENQQEEEERPTTKPTEAPTPPPTPSPTPSPTPTPPETPTTRPTDAPAPPPRPTGSPIDE